MKAVCAAKISLLRVYYRHQIFLKVKRVLPLGLLFSGINIKEDEYGVRAKLLRALV